MSDTTTVTSATAQTSPFSGQLVKCSRTGCNWTFTQGMGYVPDLKTLYRNIREGDVQPSRPLTQAEVLSAELCGNCRKLAAFPVYATQGTLDLMMKWARRNADRKERFLDRQHAILERQRARDLAYAIKREDKSPINQIFEKYGRAKPAGHKHGRRRNRTERRDAASVQATTPEPAKDKGNTKQEKGNRRKGGR